jgi:fibronectin type 3 domain-containing protein
MKVTDIADIQLAQFRLVTRLGRIAGLFLLILTALAAPSTLWSQTTFPGQIGVEVGDRPTGFVDAFKDQGRLLIDSSGNPVATDANGNPLSDGIAVVFDNRPIPAWTGSIDDPDQYQPDCSGTYSISFQGQATLSSVAGAPTLTFANQSYDPASNTTTVTVTMPGGPTYADGPALMEISFTNTQRTPSSGSNTGITGLKAIRPGFSANTTQVFDPAFLSSLAPFSYLRFMGWLGTNTSPGYYGDTGHHLITWSTRSLPTDFYQGVGNNISSNPNVNAGAWGISWEYVILLANATNKDIWINIPISATGGSDPQDPTYDTSTNSYIYQLALLLKNGDAFTGNVGLNPGLHIYIEHSNEVWNSGFLQYTWNLLAAEDEVNQGGSVLNNDGDTNQYDWAYRRHIKRLYEIAQIFQTVFGSGSLNTTIRPIYAWWQLDEGSGSNAANALAWFQKNYGPPSNYFYAMAQGDYFAATNYANDTTIPEVLSDMQASSNASVSYVQKNKATAQQYGLKLFAYEGGPDNSNGGSGTTTNIGVEILANRDSGMDTLVQDHIRNNWFAQGGDSFGYFDFSSAYSRYGSWGATDDYRNVTTAKYNALVNLLGYTSGGVPVAPGNLVATAGNQQVLLSWAAVPGATSYNVKRGLVSGGSYTVIGTVSSSTYADSSVTNGTTYYYVVTAVNSSGESAPSNEASATPEAAAPSAPTLTATPGNGQATLTWTAPPGATSYNVYQGSTSGGEGATPIATGVTTTSYTVPDLTNGSTYYFVVAAVNSLGTGPSSNEVSVAPAGPPLAPTGLSAAAGDGQATLSWTAAPGAASYNVYQGASAGGEASTPVATGVTATTYVVKGLTDGTAYYFTVAAVNASGASGFSNEATVTPSAAPPPSGLLAYEPFGEAAGALNGVSGGGDSGWGSAWVVQNSLTNVPGYNIASATPLAYPGLMTNGNYAIGGDNYVTSGRALDVSANGPFSAYLSNGLIGAPGQTIWLSFLLRKDANNGQTNSITLNANGGGQSWWVENPNIAVGYFGASSNDSNGDLYWSLQYNGTTVQSNVPVVVGQPALLVLEVTFGSTQNLVNLYVNPTSLGGAAPGAPSATYTTSSSLAFQSLSYYGGNGTGQSSLDEIRVGTSFAAVTPTPVVTTPAAPTGLAATAGNGQVQLTWNASAGAANYQVWDTTGGNYGEVASAVTGTAYTVTGLTNGTTYTFYVTASNSAGTSNPSVSASATPQGLVAPPPPQSLTATAGDAQAMLSWSAVSGATSYSVYEGTTSGGESSTPIATGITATTYTVTGLTNGTPYYFTVAAVNANGASSFSNEASVTPGTTYGPPTPITVPNYSFEADQQTGYIYPQGWNFTTSITTPPGDPANSNPAVQYVNSVTNNPVSGVTGTYYWDPSDYGEQSAPFGSETAILTSASSLGTFATNTQYTLTVALGAPNDNALSYKSIGFQLLANGVVVANFVAPTSGPGALVQGNGLSDFNLSFSTVNQPQVVGQNITVSLVYTYTGQYGRDAYFDNVRLTQASAEGGVVLPAPTGLTATAGDAQAALSWSAVSGAASYNVYQGATSGGEGSTPVATGITATNFNVTGLANGSTYYFIVAAVNASGVGSFSTEASATPSASYGIPIAPTGLTAAAADSEVTLSWSEVPGASTYNVYQGNASGGEGSTPIATAVTGTTFTATGLTDGTAYYFKVAAVNSYGTSPFSNEATATPAAPVQGTNAPADFSIYSQIIAANPVPAGFNMQPAAGTDLTENSWLADGGFSPYDARMSFTASQDGTATTFIATGGGGTSFYQSIAAGYFVGATARTYRYSNGAWSLLRTDTVSGYAANSASTAPADNTITFASSGPQILSGDITWLDMDNVSSVPNISQLDPRFTIYYPNWGTESQRGMSRGASWPYTLSTDVPSSDPGGLSLELTDTNTETNGIWQYVQGAFVGPSYEEFQPGHTYEVDVWLKQSGVGDGSVTFALEGLNITHTFTGVTGDWQHFTWTFPAVPGLPVNSVQPSAHLDFNAPGTVYIDNFQLYDAGWAPNTVNPQVLQAWADYHPGTIRIWSNFGNSSQNYSYLSLDSWLTPEIKTVNTPGIGNEYEVPAELEHLPDALANVKAVGANPWLIVNMALSETEWSELIDYLSAPAGVGYAAKRPSNHPGPYTADFSTIYLEVGNEEWGTQQVPADTAYGQWAHFVISHATAGKAYFNSSQIKFVLNGFDLEPSFGSAAVAAAPEATIVDDALYTQGNQALTGDSYYQSDMVQVPASLGPIINAIVAQQQLDAANGRVYSLAAYEEGPGADTPTHSGDTSLAAAIGAIDVNLYASQSGFGPQNLYMYQMGTGPYTSHTNFANGFRPHPIWEALQMRNNYCSGPMVLTNANSVPTTTDGNAYPLVAVYTFQDANVPNQADVVVLSRDLNNQTPVTLHFPATPTGTAQLYTLTGDPRLGNDSAMNIPIGNEQVAVTANYTFNMPPGSMYLFQVPMTGTWSNTVPPPSAPATLSASANNAQVTLTWASSSGATGYNVLRGTTSGGPYTQIAATSQIAYTDTAVTNGTTYYYVVTATNAGGASTYSPEASATPNVEDSSMTSTAPPLDGSNAGAWSSVPFVPLTHYFSGTSTDTASYKTLWDSTYLYVLVSVQDNTLTAPTEANVWSGDTVEVYFSGTDNRGTTYGPTDFQYAFPYGTAGAMVTEADHNAVTGVVLGQQNITGGYQMAMAIPWTTLGTTPVAGQQYGFDVMIDDATSQGNRIGKLAWWGTVDSTWSNPSLMGPLVLSAQTTRASSMSLAASNNAPPAGSPVTLTATVSGSGVTPTGTVVFTSGATTLCSSTLNSSGVATCNDTPAASGSTIVTVQYQGDSHYQASSASLTLNVYDASISLKSSSTQLTYPGASNLTACVAPATGATATGTMKIFDGSALLNTQTLQGNGCVYWYISPGLAAGTHVLAAAYSGDKNNPSGTSAATTLTVAPVPVNMSVSCWNASFAYGANYQCTVSASSTAGSAQGAITYSLDSGAAVSVPLSGGNAQFTVTKPIAGNHQVVIAYAQQTNYAAVTPKTESFTVTPAPVTVALTPSTYNAPAGTSISFATAISSWSAGAPNATGSVSFYDGSTLLGSIPVNASGTATFSTSSLTAGKHTITATYAGGANYASGSSSATITLAQ